MRADHDGFVGQRTFPFQHGDHILDLGLLLNDAGLANRPETRQLEAPRLQIRIDFLLQGG
jgi:hypothetical protein